MRTTSNSQRIAVSTAAAAAVGVIAWNGNGATLPLSALFFVIFLLQRARAAAYCVALAYYLGSTWPVVPGATTFFGSHTSSWEGFALWLTGSILLSSPWGLFYFRNWPARFASVAAAVTATTVPPIGLIGWASPLTSAGLLFPGLGWLGIAAMLLAPPAIVRKPLLGIVATVALIATAHAVQPRSPTPLAGWAAVDTTFGRGPEWPDPIHELQNVQEIQRTAIASPAQVIIFPETVVSRWNTAAEIFWEPVIETLRSRGQTIVLGTTVPLLGSPRRLNGTIVRGADGPDFFEQHIPVPISMWNPLSESGFPLRLWGPGTLRIAGEQVGVLICYEMLLSWPVLSLSIEHPTILVGIANDYWARNTPIPAVQREFVLAWARLFSIPALIARNT